MIDATDTPSTRPYLIRALYEWCTDNGFTPYLAVAVDDSVRVPREYVKDGQIVLNLSLDATTSLNSKPVLAERHVKSSCQSIKSAPFTRGKMDKVWRSH